MKTNCFFFRLKRSSLCTPAFFSQQKPRLFLFQFPIGTKNTLCSECCNTSGKINTLLMLNDCLKKIVYRKVVKTRLPVLSSPKAWFVYFHAFIFLPVKQSTIASVISLTVTGVSDVSTERV